MWQRNRGKKILMLFAALIISLAGLSRADAYQGEDTYWLRGALIGCVAGGLVGAGAGYAICGSGNRCFGKAGGTALFGGVGAIFGFGAGGAIGYYFKKKDKTVSVAPNLWIDPKSNAYGVGAGMNF